jgi:hypothetical protein
VDGRTWDRSRKVLGMELNRKSSRTRNALCRLCAGLLLPRWLRAAVDSRLWRWGSSVQRGVRVLSAGRNTGSGADSVDTVEVVGSALIFWPGSEKERNFSATGSVS